MSTDPRCPSCGHVNPADATTCERCNFPLREAPVPERAGAAPEGPAGDERSQPVQISMQRIRPIRPRRPVGPDQQLKLQLWIGLGTLAMAAVLYTAWQGFQKSNAGQAQVEGARAEQQQAADFARAAIARDSTDIEAQIALANVLYDTANWSEAIVHYKTALRLDSTRVTTMVDMGVCYYNLAQTEDAEALFQRALARDPKQPIALFNLGIVAENRQQYQKALDYYHQTISAGAPANMSEALQAAMKRVIDKMGKGAGGASGGTR